MRWYHHVTALVAIILITLGAKLFERYLVETYRCVPGQADPCTSVYGNKGDRICRSSGFWGDHCFVGDGRVEEL